MGLDRRAVRDRLGVHQPRRRQLDYCHWILWGPPCRRACVSEPEWCSHSARYQGGRRFQSADPAAPTGSVEITAIPGDERELPVQAVRASVGSDTLALRTGCGWNCFRSSIPCSAVHPWTSPSSSTAQARRPGVDSRAGADPSRRRRTDALDESPYGQGPNSSAARLSSRALPPHRVRLPRPNQMRYHGQRAQGGRDRQLEGGTGATDAGRAPPPTRSVRPATLDRAEAASAGNDRGRRPARAPARSSASTTPVIRPGFGCSWPRQPRRRGQTCSHPPTS